MIVNKTSISEKEKENATNNRLLLLVRAWPARPSTTYTSKWISLGSIKERASATRTPIAEEESRSGCDSGRNTPDEIELRNFEVFFDEKIWFCPRVLSFPAHPSRNL